MHVHNIAILSTYLTNKILKILLQQQRLSYSDIYEHITHAHESSCVKFPCLFGLALKCTKQVIVSPDISLMKNSTSEIIANTNLRFWIGFH